ncbi:condensation domain-containing protein [Clostridium beijerinckii]|uniref:3-oxoacyl-(Acyl-carrier-protein) synthase/acyl carrier protein n=1 Tax=Clostridium beijerinckii TaxID=1520 RepID=A0A9Q5CX87_CLOBE|nr:condensation domain-containing protein [Clostridium beijerinckii]AQS06432.1 polyketide synthase PksJ [Clostridium beijerinckii]MBA2885809.1 3-oxoacyl-(acyl-carrier-protein) synthase/acyl carrier protein [Clostridium beijerinckii]MBA2900490.1 3-oxoacyl-(acyl-carrier-protein) synthase/acyl carrier protein [Clostridium beijerinckii]MBA2910368.1 3-oxoacyl-(acyl-carrier-protein) synthase/acyl carrier protein [Clostridium beijerinckii]MBA9013948.1 3-oxoacyl-(acyl-carrier-protein) synthase/acyl ca
MYKDIAIIGISTRLPEADNLKELNQNLLQKKDCIKEVSKERRELLKLEDNVDYLQVGYIEDIEYFDNKFFNISSKEADYMCPEQRICLEMAADTILDAGYSLGNFRSKNCAVIVCSTDNEYKILSGQDLGVAFTGNLKSLTAGKICYYLDLHGPNLTLDASCASSLLAVHEGCMKLIADETDYSLVGGLSVNIYIPEYADKDFNTLGVVAKGGRSKSFDADASGTGIGEGGGFILLKRLEDAIRDKDHIYGVIKGSAANCDGGRSSSLTSPSVEGQKEAIIKAWERASINPENITEIEAHGTGTLIGDPIEVQGLQECFNKFTEKKSFAHLGAVKSSIGHLGATAGIAAIIKCIAQFENNVTYPIVHYKKANPYIEFEKTSLIPVDKPVYWTENQKRIVGINSFGFCGTNVHVVMENYLKKEKENGEKSKENIIKICGRTEKAFYENLKAVMNFIKDYDGAYEELTYTLNTGRDDYDYRKAFVFDNIKDLLNKMEEALPSNTFNDNKKVVLVLSRQKEDGLNELLNKAFLYRKMQDINIKPDYIFSDEFGKLVINYANNKITEAEAIKKISLLSKEIKIKSYHEILDKLSRDNEIILIQLSELLGKEEINKLQNVKQLDLSEEKYLNTIKELYESGIEINWTNLYKGTAVEKISAPTYVFDKNKHWIYPKERVEAQKKDNLLKEEEELVESISDENIKSILHEIWCEVLELDEIKDEDDFFDLGGNSLAGMMLIEEVEEKLKVTIKYDELFEHQTFGELTKLTINKVKIKNSQAADDVIDIIRVSDIETYELNSLQKIVYYSCIEDIENSEWNLCMAIGIKGKLDMEKLNKALAKIINKHSCFRTVFFEEDKIPKQRVLKDYEYTIKEHFIRDENNALSYELSRKKMHEEANKQIPFIEAVPLAVEVYHISDEHSILYINIHHIIGDGSTLAIFIKELSQYYNEEVDIIENDSVFQQVDYNVWKKSFTNSKKGQEQLAFWEETLKGMPSIILLEGDRAHREEAWLGDTILFTLEDTLYKQLLELSKQEKFSLFSITLLAYHILIYKRTNKKDVFTTVATANRRIKKLTGICGCLADLIIMRTIFKDNNTIRETLKNTADYINKALDNQEYPYYNLICKLENNENKIMTKISDFLMVFQNYKSSDLKLGNLELYKENIDKKGVKANISLCIYEAGNEMKGILEFNNELYSKSFIEEFLRDYIKVLEHIAKKPEDLILQAAKEGEYLLN